MRAFRFALSADRTDSGAFSADQPGADAHQGEIAPNCQAILLRDVPTPDYRRVFLLLLLALLCRIGAALWWGDLLWADSVFYHRLAEALQKGDFTTAFASLGLNVYPVILMWLDRLGAWIGADWTVVGKWWSVGMASLAILPFYGWVRRLFNERIAFWAGLFFAIHPSLVGHSPLIIRDPTYWFFFNLALYLSWRAVAEGRLWLHLGAGTAVGLAMYIRTEGILLVGVLVGWAVCRAILLRQARWQVLLGAALAVALIPTGLVVVNLTWLRDHPQWEWGRLPLLQRIWNWAADQIGNIFSLETPIAPSPGIADHGKPDPEEQNPVFSRLLEIHFSSPPGITGHGALGPEEKTPVSSQARRSTPAISLGRYPLQPPQKHRCSQPHATAEGFSAKPPPPPKPNPAPKTSSSHPLSPPKAKSNSRFPPLKAPEGQSAKQTPAEKASEWVHARRVALRLLKAMTYPYALLIGIGLLCAWRILLRFDQLVLSVHNLLLFSAVWAYQSLSGGIDYRYLFPILLSALPYAALGFERLRQALRSRASSGGNRWQHGLVDGLIATGGVLLLAGLGLLDVHPSATKLMRQQTALGQWILQQKGPGTKIFCPESASILLEYHAQAKCHTWPPSAVADYETLRRLLCNYRPEVVVLWEDPIYPDSGWMEMVRELVVEIGYEKVPAELLPLPAQHCQVWLRSSNWDATNRMKKSGTPFFFGKGRHPKLPGKSLYFIFASR